MNEVRVLCNSILLNQGKLQVGCNVENARFKQHEPNFRWARDVDTVTVRLKVFAFQERASETRPGAASSAGNRTGSRVR